MRRPRICTASIAFASDGAVIANVHNYAGETVPEKLLRWAIELGGEIFVSVRLREREVRDVLSHIDDAGHEGAGGAFVDRGRRRLKKPAKDVKKNRR
jgi:hypothetical protein